MVTAQAPSKQRPHGFTFLPSSPSLLGMSALPPIADICSALLHVRFVPITDIPCPKACCPVYAVSPLLTSAPGMRMLWPSIEDERSSGLHVCFTAEQTRVRSDCPLSANRGLAWHFTKDVAPSRQTPPRLSPQPQNSRVPWRFPKIRGDGFDRSALS